MTPALDARSLRFVLIAIFLTTLPHVQNVAWPVFAFFSAMCGWRAATLRWPQLLPGRILLFLLLVLGIALLVSLRNGLFGRDAGTSVLIVALGLKLLEIKSRREIELLAYLAFVMAASQFLYDQNLWLAGYVMLVCAALLTTLTAQNVLQIHTRAALRSALVMLAQALPLTIVIFVLFPRFQAPHWSWLNSDNKARSGLGREMEPGAIAELSLSDELVFRAQFKGEPPANPQRYWRGVVYSITDGKRWTALELPKANGNPTRCQQQRYEYTLLLEPQKENWVLALDRSILLPGSLEIDTQQQIHRHGNPGERAEFSITACTDYVAPATEQELRINLQLPTAPSASIRALIQQLRGAQDKPEQLVNNLLNHFKQQPFSYTLKPEPLGDQPIETFLFKTRSGFCSHYATAMVYVLRAAKIPARVIGGYQGGVYNPEGQFIEVRQADAHAWAEVWLDDKGWVRVDPTAAISPERIERGVDIERQLASGLVNYLPSAQQSKAPSWLTQGRMLWNNLDYQWQHWIINYDRDLQNQILQGLGIQQLTELLRWLIASFLLTGAIMLGWLFWGRKPKISPALGEYQRFCRQLAKAGITILPGEAERDFALRAQTARPDLAPAIARITALFVRLQYEAEPKRDDLIRLKQLVKALRV